jgi:hypothetical protein
VYIKFHQHQFVQNVLWGKENDLAWLLTMYGATKTNGVLNMSLLHWHDWDANSSGYAISLRKIRTNARACFL